MPRNGFRLRFSLREIMATPFDNFGRYALLILVFHHQFFFLKNPPHICKAFSNNKKKSTSFQMNATRFQVGKSKILILFVEIIKEHFGLYIYECRTPCKFDLDLAASVKKK